MRKWLAMTASVALLGIASYAVILAVADIYLKEGVGVGFESFLEAVGTDSGLLSEPEVVPEWSWKSQALWEEAHRFLQLARILDPLNPDVYSDLGQLHELRVPEQGSLDADALAVSDRALEYYRRSVVLRPAWPHGWTNVALVKLRQWRLDGEFALAMERATTLGPWEPGVQYGIAGGALKVLDDLPNSVQDIVRLTVERGLQHDLELFAEFAEQYGFTSAGDGYR